MKGNSLLHSVLFALVMVGLFGSLQVIKNSNDEEHTHMNQQFSISTSFLKLKNIVSASLAFADWQFNKVPAVSEHPEQPQNEFGISPNLSSCHSSFANPVLVSKPVYCCPPKPYSDEDIIDFEFPNPSEPLRIRKRAHLQDSDYIAKYARALSIMKSLPYDDPRSYARQADVHCIFCTGAFDRKYSNQFLNVHRSWFFFPWHRMYIYFHERILASLIDDDTFSLSMWNWDTPEGMVLPDMYVEEPFLDTERSDFHTHRPRIVNINYNLVEINRTSEEQISLNLAVMYHQMVSGAKKMELFMGCIYKSGINGSCDGAGTVEQSPHDSLHGWVGKESNRYLEHMGVFYAAARDPIFFAHHSNLDRLWNVWEELRNTTEPEIIDPDWLESQFYFYNEKAQLVRIKVRDVLNMTKLRYAYEEVDNLWLNARPKPSVDPTIARHALNMKHNGYLTSTQSNDFRPEGRALDSSITVKVQRPKNGRKTENDEEILIVYGIFIKEDVYVKFDVYINAVDAINIGPESREFAGTYVNLPRGITRVLNDGEVETKSKTTLKLGISELLNDLQANEEDSIWVTLVPRGGTGVHTSVDGIRIEYMS